MAFGKRHSGVTLVEMVIVVGVIMILAGVVLHAVSMVDRKGKVRLCENTVAIVNTALEEFAEYRFKYPDKQFWGLKFPMDVEGKNRNYTETVIEEVFDYTNVTIVGDIDDYSSSVMYFILSEVPECRKTLGDLDKSLVTNKDKDGNEMTITITRNGNNKVYPLMRIVDPWGKTLQYDYYDEDESDWAERYESRRNFPVVTSAGPDGDFNQEADNISSR